MLYTIAHFLRDKMPWLWDLVDVINSCLFSLRYGRKLKDIEEIVIKKYSEGMRYKICRMRDVDASILANFFAAQPEDAYKYFKPHKFDTKTIKKLQRNKAFLAYLVTNEQNYAIVGYCFIRCFFNGKCFRGKIVDYRWRNCGIAKLMGRISTDVAMHIGLRMYGTISKKNITSMASSAAVNEIRIIKNLPNDFVYIEYLPKNEMI